MFNPDNVSISADAKPFLIYIRHRDKERNVSWRPDAFVGFSRGLRTSGFLAALPAEELKSLLILLSFVTANGNVTPSVLQLAEAFHLSQTKTRRRMERLLELTWAGEPLVYYRRFESGLDAFVPQTGLFAVEEEPDVPESSVALPYQPAPRAVIVEHSRRHYARPRAEVEEMVLRQLRPPDAPLNQNPSSPPPTAQPPRGRQIPSPRTMDNLTTEQKETMRQLQNWGVSTEQAASLLTRFDVARIQRQIAWLPARRVKSPNGFLIAAIEGDYEAPRGLLPVKRTQTAPDEESDSGPAANPTP